jgi:hypothetical protein
MKNHVSFLVLVFLKPWEIKEEKVKNDDEFVIKGRNHG